MLVWLLLFVTTEMLKSLCSFEKVLLLGYLFHYETYETNSYILQVTLNVPGIFHESLELM